MNEWIYFKADYAVGAIELKDNKIITTPPIWKKYIGLDFEEFKKKFPTGCGWSKLPQPPKQREGE